ncbi:hypothetical protein C1752_04456 [Acaryochloris thomasi RCC1774]|uniref:Uncharacterized protein n=1 Tax=Acaryochloris thomasi RCC1774 TaxID=1764569 RepID=A0A2W1JDA1_9CYAN|nr:hypothetical protein [Acaryochloris thomasi]PZD71746.1 hypothetical protein C1752_04456 [Acaryochloris thomasi RCC1774]
MIKQYLLGRSLTLLSAVCIVLGTTPLFLLLVKASENTTIVTVDWDKRVGRARNIYSLNLWSATAESVGTNTSYASRIGEIYPHICRFHSAEMLKIGHPKAWIKMDGQWNEQKIGRILSFLAPKCESIMISIPNWSPTLHRGGKLPTSKYDDFARWCAQLVDIVKNRQKYNNVRYFEVLNERDQIYDGSSEELAAVVRHASAKMRSAHPRIKIVGGSWTQPFDDSDIQTFLDNVAATDIQAFSYHHYGTSGSITDLNILYDRAKSVGRRGAVIRSWMDSRGLSKAELFHDEMNIYSNWRKDSKRYMRSYRSAVFMALVYKYASQRGKVDSVMPWNDADEIYGVLSRSGSSYRFRPAGHLLRILRREFSDGELYSSSTSDPDIKVLAVRSKNKRVVMIVNRSLSKNKNFSIDMNIENFNSRTYKDLSINSLGFSASRKPWNQNDLRSLNISKESIRFFVFN